MLNSSGWSALATTAIILRSRSAAASSGATRVLSFWSRSLVSKNLRRSADVLPQVLVRQAQFVEQDARPGPPGSCGCRAGCRAASRPRSRVPRWGSRAGTCRSGSSRSRRILASSAPTSSSRSVVTPSSMRNGRVFWNSRSGSFQKTIRALPRRRGVRAPCGFGSGRSSVHHR